MTETATSSSIKTIAILGAGLIGCSWAAMFAASGRRIHLFDSHIDSLACFREFWSSAQKTLADGWPATAFESLDVVVFDSAAAAVANADFIQENIPERLEAKRQLYAGIENALRPGVVISTSSSGLKLSDLQSGLKDPSNLIIGHPFNPPHIIPLVELYGNDRTNTRAIEIAHELYEACGKKTITLKREVMGHVANRLQAALWREAIHLVAEDVVSVRDVDIAISEGPGMRWAVMGPHMLLNLGGGPAGIKAYCDQFRDSYTEWWDDLGKPQLTPETVQRLIDGLKEEVGQRDYDALRKERDSKLVALRSAIRKIDAMNEKLAIA